MNLLHQSYRLNLKRLSYRLMRFLLMNHQHRLNHLNLSYLN